MVIMNGKPVKACTTLVQPWIKVVPAEGLPALPEVNTKDINLTYPKVSAIEIPVLIIGGGPAGLSAAMNSVILG